MNRSRRATDSVRLSRMWTTMSVLNDRESAGIRRRAGDLDVELLRRRSGAAARRRDRREGNRSRRRFVRYRECLLRPDFGDLR